MLWPVESVVEVGIEVEGERECTSLISLADNMAASAIINFQADNLRVAVVDYDGGGTPNYEDAEVSVVVP